MPGFETSFGRAVHMERELSNMERLHAMIRDRERRIGANETMSVREELDYIALTREVLLNELTDLERMRHEYRTVPREDRELLDVMVDTRPSLLDPAAIRDVRVFQSESSHLSDAASTLIAYLQQLNLSEQSVLKGANLLTVEEEQKARVRAMHLATIDREWEAMGEKH